MEQPANYVNHQKTNQQQDAFYIEQYFVKCLAEFSYYIESQKEAMIIDPLRDIDAYLKVLKERGTKLKYIALTHLHADFVSGQYELQKETGATILFGPTANVQYEVKVCQDGEKLPLGNINIRVDHTPGHTMESSCFVLLTPEQKEYWQNIFLNLILQNSVFTGDTLFLGEVGRPDLAVKEGAITKEDLAGYLFDSLRNKVMKYPDDCVVYPGHGAGSSCGKSIGAGSSCTIGIQKQKNYALQDMARDDFVKLLSSNLPTPPQYFFHDAAQNRKWQPPLKEFVQKSQKPLNYKQFVELVKQGCKILDTRDEISDGIVEGAYNIQFGGQFATWVGTIFKPDDKIVLITEEGQADLTIIRMARIGYYQVQGYLEGGFKEYQAQGGKIDMMKLVTPKEFLEGGGINDFQNIFEHIADDIFLDVRRPNEWVDGIYPGALCIQLMDLEKEMDKIPKDKNVHVYCAAGARARMGAFIIKKGGVKNVIITTLGIKQICEESGVALVKP